MLPQDFVNRMKDMLGDEYESFIASYDRERYHALRINTLKVDNIDSMPFIKERVSWTRNGYYFEEDKNGNMPGKHPYHNAGVYYIQEPSAMLPGERIGAKPGERILDLCAAPGGKSTQIAADMKGEGILFCNEIDAGRAKILSENVERMGIKNAIVTNETPTHLAEVCSEYFDKIMVDAPCSGEGMFIKNENAIGEWSKENVDMCAKRQESILECAHRMLKYGGIMVYSTCTFSEEENENNISSFVDRHREYVVESEERLWPHKVKGEGHFVAVLRKKLVEEISNDEIFGDGLQKGIVVKNYPEFMQFMEDNVHTELKGIYVMFGDQMYLLPEDCPSLKGIKVLRAGLHLGTIKKNRFEPSHSLALALKPCEVTNSIELSGDSTDIRDYIKGMTLENEGCKGWYLICVDGYSIGWGKQADGQIKNHYPKGLRV